MLFHEITKYENAVLSENASESCNFSDATDGNSLNLCEFFKRFSPPFMRKFFSVTKADLFCFRKYVKIVTTKSRCALKRRKNPVYHPQIQTFIAVAESGSFSKAAEILFVTPTAVMKQINALEKRLSVTLFNRTNHGLSLTSAGKSFLQDAKYLFDYSARAIEKIREIAAAENQRSIRIGTSVMTPSKFVLDVWTKIQDADPNLKIEMIPFVNTPENARGLLQNLGIHIDVVAGIYDDNLVKQNNFQIMPLQNKKILIAVPLSDPLSEKDVVRFDDLKNKSVMVMKQGWNIYIDQLRKLFKDAGVKIIDFDFFSLNAFNHAVKENVPIIAIDGWENIHPLLKIKPVEWDCRIAYGIMYSKEPTKQAKKFIEIISEITAEN